MFGFVLGSAIVLTVAGWVVFQVAMPKVATGERFLTPYGAELVSRGWEYLLTYVLVAFDVTVISVRWLRHELAQLTQLAVRAAVLLATTTWRLGTASIAQLVNVLSVIGWLLVVVAAATVVICIEAVSRVVLASWELLRAAARWTATTAEVAIRSLAQHASAVPQHGSALFDRTGKMVQPRRIAVSAIDLRVPTQQPSDAATPAHGIRGASCSDPDRRPEPALAD